MNHNPAPKQMLLRLVIGLVLVTMPLWLPPVAKLYELKQAGRIPFVEGSESYKVEA